MDMDISPPRPKKMTRGRPPQLKKLSGEVGLKAQERHAQNSLHCVEKEKRQLEKKLNSIQSAKKHLTGVPSVISDQELKSKAFASVDVAHAPIIFQPNKGPQSVFLSASEQEVLYGGAAGSGKTMAIIADSLRDTSNGAFVGLIIRRTTDELREIKAKTLELYPQVYPSAKWSERDNEWKFPSGSRLWLTYLERDADVLRYQGQAFSYIAVDELTQYQTPYAWDYLRSRLRTTDKHLKVYQRASTNPGGPGHNWVKKMFIDPAPWGESFDARDLETGEILKYPANHDLESLRGKALFKRRFIPGRLKDNPFLYEDGKYEANLLSMPEHQRKQLLEGSWDVVEGAAFPEFNRSIHVIKREPIPQSWRKFRAADYGYTSRAGCLWFAVNPNGQLVIYRELYTRLKTADKFALEVLEMEKEDVSYGMLDSSCFHKKGDVGVSLAEQMTNVGCFWRPSDRSPGSRKNGKNELHRRLSVNETTELPGIVIHDSCVNLIAQLPLLQLDKNDTDDVDTKGEDHLYDALRYGIMSRPAPVDTEYMILQKPTYHTYQPADQVFGY